MKIYSNYPEPTLSTGLAALLVDSLDYNKGEVWLISPWLKDVRLPIAALGDFASLLGGQRDEIDFSKLLALVAQQHKLHIVTKPPGELVPFGDVKRLAYKLNLRKSLSKEKEEELKGYSIIDELIEELNTDIIRLASAATVHAETIRIGRMLQAKGAELYYLNKLHAKLLWTPIGALIGSANFTNAGLNYNDELVLKINDDNVFKGLLREAKNMADRAVTSQNYTVNKALEKAEYKIKEYLDFVNNQELKDYPELQQLLQQLTSWIKSS